MRNLLVEKLMDLGPAYLTDQRSGKLQSLVTDGVEYMEPFIIEYIPQVLVVLFAVCPLTIYVYTINVIVGVVLTVCIFFAIFMPHLMMPIVRKSTVEYWRGYAKLNAQYVDTMQGMTTLKVFHAGAAKEKELAKDSEAFRKQQIYNTSFSLFASSTINLMMVAGGTLSTAIAGYFVSRESMILLLFIVIECMRPIGELYVAWHASYLGFSVSDDFLNIMNEPLTITEKADAKTDGINDLPEISWKGVDFAYPSTSKNVINDLDLTIKPGETVAIVGMSGSGKSTLVNLLLRFYDVTKGSLTINGTNIKDYSLEYLRKKIAVVFQESYLFYGSVAENLRIVRPDATDEELIEAAKKANAHEFIMELPEGYNTLVGERGATLSGGQRQRLSIARAILKDAPILVLDEATSSVDAASEKIIQETTEGLAKNHTTLIIAHRLSTIQNVNRILVFDKGRLVQMGTHSELANQPGIYQKLIEAQKRSGEIDAA
ncbi:Lipid A export ATP-binding/permease protein MsbA [Lachnospiraceae bacterium TWA4]|nr:Lipid A export ATP-binding/permease protein MsbA [Lachnospiraceae bacterium TWA4]